MKSTQKSKKATKTGKDKRTERDRFAVVLESIQTDFQIFGEKLEFLDEKVERGFQKTNLKLEEIEFELNAIKIEIQTLRDTRFQKADFKKLEILEKRVFVLEKAIGRV